MATTTSKINARSILYSKTWTTIFRPSNTISLKVAKSNTAAILIKLLATRMVANNFLGRSKSFEIIWNAIDFCCNPLSISALVKEKKATSAPEISAEHVSNISIEITRIIYEKLSEARKIRNCVGSGSKTNELVRCFKMVNRHFVRVLQCFY